MSFTKKWLADDIRALGIGPGDAVVVHSSFKKLGTVEGGPAAFIEALAEILLPDGALLFPNLYIPHEFTAGNPPRFDLKKDSIKKLGVIPETFKFHYAEHFSVHPTHSMMGMGRRCGEILSGHEKAGCPCGAGTPWHKNALSGGKILLAGVGQQSNTTYHTAEELMENTFKLSKDVIRGEVVFDGRTVVVPSRLHLWNVYHADFNVLNPELEEAGLLKKGLVGEAETLCLNAKGFIDLALSRLDSTGHLK
ncbi:MAG: AAC(3) family N-acetyltransferase [Verrucomicrobiae bacterium]|nr:AAC(3) family N-acetyltransferase [Verrucomicrobiae bacterium]